jgi:hypothetical protein
MGGQRLGNRETKGDKEQERRHDHTLPILNYPTTTTTTATTTTVNTTTTTPDIAIYDASTLIQET